MKSYDDVVDFHGHSCPGLALGYRVALRALGDFKVRSMDEEIVAVVENDSCAVDAVQVVTGCTFGKGNLVFRDYGKQVYTFIERSSGRSIRISIDWKKPEEKGKDKVMWERYMKGDRTKKVLDFVHSRKASKIRSILDADDRSLMRVSRGKEKIIPRAKIYPSIICSSCGEKVMEPRARIKTGAVICIPCYERNQK